jgi:hypothetical protein
MFQVSLQDQFEGRVTVDHVDDVLYEFHSSEKKRTIHRAIRMIDQHSFERDNVVEKIRLLVKENQVRKFMVANCHLSLCAADDAD